MRKRTAQSIEEQKANLPSEAKGKRKGIGRGNHPNSRKGTANLIPFVPGQSGNAGGLPGTDLAALIARRAFEQISGENDPGMVNQLRKGNAYAFNVLADRAYGKLKEKIEHGADEKLLAALEAGRKRIRKAEIKH